MKGRRVESTLDIKIKLIKDSENVPKLTIRQLGEKYEVSKSTA